MEFELKILSVVFDYLKFKYVCYWFSCLRYELQMVVSDHVWRQEGVSANVTVVVQLLDPESLTHAVPLTISGITAREMTRDWRPEVLQ